MNTKKIGIKNRPLRTAKKQKMVVGDGFEPSKAVLADLQSAPFGHSGIHPSMEPIGLEPMTLCL